MAWKIIFFETPRGERVVEEFIFTLQEKAQAKVGHEIDLLERHGPFLGMPHSKQLTKSLYELRVKGKEEVRILYTFRQNNIFLLHAFKKKSNKTPQKELYIAQRRLIGT